MCELDNDFKLWMIFGTLGQWDTRSLTYVLQMAGAPRDHFLLLGSDWIVHEPLAWDALKEYFANLPTPWILMSLIYKIERL